MNSLPLSSCTFVTAYINLKNEIKPFNLLPEEYISLFEKLSSSFDSKMQIILYVNQEIIDSVEKFAKKNILLRPIDITTLELYPDLEKMKGIYQYSEALIENKYYSNKISPEYIFIINSKVDLLQRAIDENPYSSTHFAWFDFGLKKIIHPDDHFSIIGDKIRIQLINYASSSNTYDPSFEGLANTSCGYFTGRKDFLQKFISLFREKRKLVLNSGFLLTEERIFLFLFYEFPELFNFYYGKYEDILTNYSKPQLSIDVIHHYFMSALRSSDVLSAKSAGFYLWSNIHVLKKKKKWSRPLFEYLINFSMLNEKNIEMKREISSIFWEMAKNPTEDFIELFQKNTQNIAKYIFPK